MLHFANPLPFSLRRQHIIGLHDVAVVTLALPAAAALRANFDLVALRNTDLLANTGVLFAVAALLYGLIGPSRHMWRYASPASLIAVARWALMTTLLFTLAMFLIDRLDGIARSVPIMQLVIAIAALWGSRTLYFCLRQPQALSLVRPNWHAVQPVLLIGGGDGAALVIQMITQNFLRRYRVVGVLDDDSAIDRTIYGVPVLGGLADLGTAHKRLAVQGIQLERLVVTKPHHDLGHERLGALETAAQADGLSICQLPEFLHLAQGSTGKTSAVDDARPQRSAYGVIRRAADIVVSGTALTLLAPLIALIALGIRIAIGRQILFNQVRPGSGGRAFTLHKFCTMRDAIAPDGRLLNDAERTPWFGRLLRRSRLDELPQFCNILLGDMSLIGPRPLLSRDLPQVSDDAMTLRRSIRPGVTGWAQVNGGHQLTGEQKLALDLWYIRHRNLLLDLKIVVFTVRMMVFGERVNRPVIERAEHVMASRHQPSQQAV